MNKEPETYEELIRQRRCVDLVKYYNLTDKQLNEIYEFLKNNPTGIVKGDIEKLILMLEEKIISVIFTKCIDSTIDGLNMSDNSFNIIPHYTPSSGSSLGSFGGSSGGFSSNNNNNNNNNR